MSIDLVIGGYHGKEEFRESMNINEILISGRNITRIFRLSHVQCKKYRGDVLRKTVMDTIGYSLNNICSSIFLVEHMKVKHSLDLLPMVVLLQCQGQNK